jgi:hypothetical protein
MADNHRSKVSHNRENPSRIIDGNGTSGNGLASDVETRIGIKRRGGINEVNKSTVGLHPIGTVRPIA